MFDYEKIGYTRVGEPNVTESGMTRIHYEQVDEKTGKLSTIITSEFSDKHPMYKKYGVREMVASGYCDKKPNRFYTLRADVFGREVEFKAEPCWKDEIKPNNEVAKFLQRLKKGINYKQTKFLENLVEIAKYIKK